MHVKTGKILVKEFIDRRDQDKVPEVTKDNVTGKDGRQCDGPR